MKRYIRSWTEESLRDYMIHEYDSSVYYVNQLPELKQNMIAKELKNLGYSSSDIADALNSKIQDIKGLSDKIDDILYTRTTSLKR